MLRQWLKGTRVSDYADKLGAQMKPDDEKKAAAGDPVAWANESHDIARDVVYVGVVEKEVTRLEQNYVDAAKPVTDKRLARAGVKLAMVLNKTLGGPTTRPVR